MIATIFNVRNDKGEKVGAWPITAPTLDAAAERLVKRYGVTVTNSGTVRFVDDRGTLVWLNLAVAAGETEKGKAALRAWKADKRAAAKAEAEAAEERQKKLDDALCAAIHKHGFDDVLEVIRSLK